VGRAWDFLQTLPREGPDPASGRCFSPAWSTLTFADGGQPFSLSSGHTTGWRQSIGLRTGVIGTTAHWTAPDGHLTDLAYQTFTDRASQNVGVVSLTLVPHWSGTATVTDTIDGAPRHLVEPGVKGLGSEPAKRLGGDPGAGDQYRRGAREPAGDLRRCGPVITLRASSYRLQVSSNASTGRTVATVAGRTSGTLDVLRFKAVRARFVRLAIAAAPGGGGGQPLVQEPTVTG
jgi:hypothetical protein